MTRVVLFMPQNDSHAETVALLDREIAKRGLRSVVLDLDGVYHQGTAAYLEGMTIRSSGLSTDRPFYRMRFLDQLRVVASARGLVSSWLDGIDAVVAFNDGALQRLVLVECRRRGTPTDLVLDGMTSEVHDPLSPRSIARRLLRWAGRLLDRTSMGAFFPSELGLFPVDRTHVAGEHSLAVLRSRGSRSRRLIASGLPRWPDPAWQSPARVERVLYLTGAWRWHGEESTAIAQEQDVTELAAVCAALGLTLMIRVHPRDEAHRYEGMAATTVEPRSESITSTIRRSDLVLSIISTGLIEGIILGKPTRVLAIHPHWSRFARSFVADPIFGAIRDRGQLQAELERMAGIVDAVAIDAQRNGIAQYVAATGSRAAAGIAANIGEPM